MPEAKYLRLKAFAERRGVSLNSLVNEMVARGLEAANAEDQFQLRAVRGLGQTERGVELLRIARDRQ